MSDSRDEGWRHGLRRIRCKTISVQSVKGILASCKGDHLSNINQCGLHMLFLLKRKGLQEWNMHAFLCCHQVQACVFGHGPLTCPCRIRSFLNKIHLNSKALGLLGGRGGRSAYRYKMHSTIRQQSWHKSMPSCLDFLVTEIQTPPPKTLEAHDLRVV